MHIKPQHLEAALAKANELNDHYGLHHLTGADPQKYVDYFLSSCGAFGIGPVRIVEIDIAFEDSAVYSVCVMNKDGATDIALAKGLNHCWKRYTICKELVHVLIDREEYRNLNLSQHTEEVAVAFSLDDSRPGLAVTAELLSEISSMEFLFPYAHREKILRLQQTPNFLAIAQQYRIPQLLVDRYLGARHMESLKGHSRRLA